ncbi:MAG TPA: hypothetical protein VEY09_06250 [Pyrinomonadaceae bacterium]|nr:hypothetical protein [Pyrinomonadaceae bacterium]
MGVEGLLGVKVSYTNRSDRPITAILVSLGAGEFWPAAAAGQKFHLVSWLVRLEPDFLDPRETLSDAESVVVGPGDPRVLRVAGVLFADGMTAGDAEARNLLSKEQEEFAAAVARVAEMAEKADSYDAFRAAASGLGRTDEGGASRFFDSHLALSAFGAARDAEAAGRPYGTFGADLARARAAARAKGGNDTQQTTPGAHSPRPITGPSRCPVPSEHQRFVGTDWR